MTVKITHRFRKMQNHQTPDLMETTLLGFTDMLTQFLDATSEVWPEDTVIRDYKLKINLAVNQAISPSLKKEAMEKLINKWHQYTKPYYQRCAQRDPTVFTETESEMIVAINLREKWLDPGIDEDTRDAIWEYVLEMNKYAQLYSGLFSQIPSNTLGKIQSTAMGLAAKIEAGQMNLADLDLNKLGQDVVNDLDEGEIEQFTQNIMRDPSVLQNLCSSMLSGTGMNMQDVMQSAMGGNGGGTPQAAAALAALQMMQSGRQ